MDAAKLSTQCPTPERMLDFSLGKLPRKSLDLIGEHVDNCHDCQAMLASLKVPQDTLVSAVRAAAVTAEEAGLDPSVQQAVDRIALQPPSKTNRPHIGSDGNTVQFSSTATTPVQAAEGVVLSFAQFVQALDDAELLSREEVQQFIDALPVEQKPVNAQDLARELVRRDMLTKFQANSVCQGKAAQLIYGDYVVLDRIGAGGMGQVFKARHRHMDRIVALKVLPRSAMKSADAVKRFRREVTAVARLSHPNIVAAYDAGQSQGQQYLVMEFAEGSDLSNLVKTRGPLAFDQAIDLVIQAAHGLTHAHAQGIIHRDIKPSNLMLDKHGVLKVLDLGLARIENPLEEARQAEGLTTTGNVMGTVDYMSPEQAIDTRQADARSDIYSLGCTLHYLLIGAKTYEGSTAMATLVAHREAPIPYLSLRRDDIPAQIDSVFQRMVAKHPDDRFQTAEELITALEQVRSLGGAVGIDDQSSRSNVLQSLSGPLAVRPPVGSYRPESIQPSSQQDASVPAKTRPPRIALLATLAGGFCLCLVAGLVILMQTPQGTIEVELDEGVADSVSVTLTGAGRQVEVADRQNRWKVNLREGQYEVKVVGGDQQVSVDKQSVTIKRGENQLVRVALRKEPDKVANLSATGTVSLGAKQPPAESSGPLEAPKLLSPAGGAVLANGTTLSAPIGRAQRKFRVLIDASNDGGVWWFPQTPPKFDSDKPHQGKRFADVWKARGCDVRELGRAAKNVAEELPEADLVVYVNAAPPEKELADGYLNWVKNGGTLLLAMPMRSEDQGRQWTERLSLSTNRTQVARWKLDFDHRSGRPVPTRLHRESVPAEGGLYAVSRRADSPSSGELHVGTVSVDKGRVVALSSQGTLFSESSPFFDQLYCHLTSLPLPEFAVWEFAWSAVPGTEKYHLMVLGPGAVIPMIDDQLLSSPSYYRRVTGIITDQNASGWRWKVRARRGNEWSPWSEESTFNVAPLPKAKRAAGVKPAGEGKPVEKK